MSISCWERVRNVKYLLKPCLKDCRDGNIRYYEYEHDKFEYLSEYKSADPQRGVAFLPKRGLNVHDNEVMRAFKTVNDNYIEPISFIVPRRAEVFQGDIYPPVTGTRPAMTSAKWFEGEDALPPKIDLESVYAGEEPAEVPSDYRPRPSTPPKAPALIKKEPEPTMEAPQPSAALRSPLPSMNEQTSSIAALASKFADKDADEPADEADTSSFEGMTKPADNLGKQSHSAPLAEEKVESAMPIKALDDASSQPTMPAMNPAPAARSEPQMLKVCLYTWSRIPQTDIS